ncbi:hypothetical protein GQE99_00535 [Maritimibacter sp. DP07]|jgi:hypothetical protein|uniref:Oxidoreductase molybdopterin-binding domain-containing protein n=1 Tax=Maritimibacter harenae TaxID=2606218 RepID=A0A845LZJ6_9RHOB|nr:hypothetical protein [Maritimibacter harenae]MZR11518.1 hypothetical protein [Maritimibacter harenae]
MKILGLLGMALLCLAPTLATANPVLTITSDVKADAPLVVRYDLEDLEALAQARYDTINDFVDVPTEFSGPLLRDVLAPLSVPEDATLELIALNDYRFDMPYADAANYDVMVALERDGERMSVRENGPLWIIYPMSDHPELQAPIYNSRLVWQLTAIAIK